jgi:hypothetical protein
MESQRQGAIEHGILQFDARTERQALDMLSKRLTTLNCDGLPSVTIAHSGEVSTSFSGVADA